RAVRPSSGGSTLSATTRRSPTSVALNTTAIPPRASSCSTEYSPASTIRSRCSRSSPLSDGTMSVASCGSPTSVPQCPQNRAGGGEDVREPARQRRRPNHHRQREPYRRATGSHQGTPASKGGYIFGAGHFDSNSVAHTVGQALAPSLIVPIAAPAEAPKFLRTAPPE